MGDLIRRPRLVGLALAVFLALVAIPAAALALPDDPPIQPLSPADGTSLFAGETGSVHVTFKCPSYHKQADETGTDIDYKVRFSTSAARDGEGLISPSLGTAFSEVEPTDKTTCGANFEAPVPARPTALYQGTVYWQVVRQVIRPACPTCGPETPKQKEEREEKEEEEATKEEEAEENGTVFVAKSEFEGGEVRSFSLQPKVEGAALKLPRVIYAGYRSAIEFESLTDLTGGTVELQRFVKGTWQPLAEATVGESTAFFVKLPAGHVVLRPVAKSASVTLPLEPRKLTVHKLGPHRLTSAAEDGRYTEKPTAKMKKAGKKPLPLSFAVVDGGTRVVHLRATIEGVCTPTTRSGEEVPLTIKAALRSARIAPDGTVVAQTETKGPEPQRVSLVGQLLDGSLFGKVTTSFANCGGSREIKAFPVG
ncbi:MAG TPA: hypothetical protein VJ204_18835 [Solirubrobacterales bacterium]|nr:hypothetical protein [Solirubrobacterales bacterium]